MEATLAPAGDPKPSSHKWQWKFSVEVSLDQLSPPKPWALPCIGARQLIILPLTPDPDYQTPSAALFELPSNSPAVNLK